MGRQSQTTATDGAPVSNQNPWGALAEQAAKIDAAASAEADANLEAFKALDEWVRAWHGKANIPCVLAEYVARSMWRANPSCSMSLTTLKLWVNELVDVHNAIWSSEGPHTAPEEEQEVWSG